MQATTILEAYPDVLTAKDIQSILHILRSNTYSLINSEELKILHIGKRKLVLKAELIRWIERNSPKDCYALLISTEFRSGYL